MTIRLASVAAGCAALLLSAGLAVAQPRITPPGGGGGGGGGPSESPSSAVIAGTTLQLTMKMLESAGFKELKIYEAQSGRRHVSGKLGDALVSVLHQNCQEEVCSTLTFYIDFGEQDSIDAKYINAWNNGKLYAKMARDDDGSVNFSMDAVVADVAPQYITRVGSIFAMMFKHVLTWRPDQK